MPTCSRTRLTTAGWQWPTETVTNVAEVTLKGRASPLARVLVAGRKVEIAADGTFAGTVTLKRGRQNVAVVVLDAFGRQATRTRQFTLDPDAPRIKGRVEPYR